MLKLMLTDQCNLNCHYCYEGNKKKYQMNMSTGKKALDFYFELLLREYENIGVFPIVFHGGEPLLQYSLMTELTEYAKILLKKYKNEKVKKCVFSFTSNGILLEKSMFTFLKENDFKVAISIDGMQKTHDANRVDYRGKGTFSTVIGNAKELQRVLGKNLCVRMTVTPFTIETFADNVRWLLEEGFYNIGIALDYFSDWQGKYDFIRSQFEEIFNLYIEYRKANKTIQIDLFDNKIGCYLIKEEPLFCNAGYGSITIDADGTIYPCVFAMNNEFSIGNINDGINREYYNNQFLKHLKVESLTTNVCSDCSIQYFCHAKKCGFLNAATTGYLNVCNQVVCCQEKALYPLIEKIVDTFQIKLKTGNVQNV